MGIRGGQGGKGVCNVDGQYDPIRPGDKEAAASAIDHHGKAGRLSGTEVSERLHQIRMAQDRAALAMIFMDLPEPHPPYVISHYLPGRLPAPPPVQARDGLLQLGMISDPSIDLDTPLGHSMLTRRKLRTIGWIGALGWIPTAAIALDSLPNLLGLQPLLILGPAWVMTMVNVFLSPAKPRWKTIRPLPPHRGEGAAY